MNGWELAWIIVGCLTYLYVGFGLYTVMTMDSGGPDNPVVRALARLGFALLWLPLVVFIWTVGLLMG